MERRAEQVLLGRGMLADQVILLVLHIMVAEAVVLARLVLVDQQVPAVLVVLDLLLV
jgi:hypothetical protein